MMYNTLTGMLGARFFAKGPTLCLRGLSGMQFLEVDPEHLTDLCVDIPFIFNCLFGKFAAVLRHDSFASVVLILKGS